MAIVENISNHALQLSTGQSIGPGQTGNTDPSQPTEAAMIAAGQLIVTDGTVSPLPVAYPAAPGVPAFAPYTRYPAGYTVVYSNTLYAAKVLFSSGASFSAGDWNQMVTALPSSVVIGSLPAGGTADDTAALQAAINSAAAGSVLYGTPSAVYTLNGMLTFPNDNVTIDFRGAQIRNGAARTGGTTNPSNNASDTLIDLAGRTNVRLLNGRLVNALSAFTGASAAAKIIVNTGARCVVEGWEAFDSVATSQFVGVQGGTDHAIRRNHTVGHQIAGFSTTHCVVEQNVLENVDASASGGVINWTGYSGAGGNFRNVFRGNTIRGHKGFAIQDYAVAVGYTVDTEIVANVIEAPNAAAASATGISATGTGHRIDQNTLVDAYGYGIETTNEATSICHNRLRWSTQLLANSSSAVGIVLNGSGGAEAGCVVAGNRLYGPFVGIQQASVGQASILITANYVNEPLSIGIDLAGTGYAEGAICSNNVIRFTTVPYATDRTAIKTATNSTVTGNRIIYTAASYAAPGHYDIILYLLGNDVVFANNTIDGGGRTGYTNAGTGSTTPTRWRFMGNAFINGATCDLSGFSAFVGPIINATQLAAQGNTGTYTNIPAS